MPQVTKTIEVEGLKELEEALKELPKATAKNTIRRAIAFAAIPIINTATVLCKVRRIRPSIVVSKIKFASGGSAGRQAYADAMKSGATRAEAGEAAHAANAATGSDDPSITSGVAAVGPTRAAFYGFEYGTKHIAPKPFMRPAWDAHKTQALDLMKSELKEQIDKAVKRIAAKQARMIAKAMSK